MELYLSALKGVVDQSGIIALSGGNLVMLFVSFQFLFVYSKILMMGYKQFGKM